MPTRIVTHAFRPKRVPRKKVKAAAITGPAIVTVTNKRDRIRRLAAADNNTEASPEIKAFFARMSSSRSRLVQSGKMGNQQ